MLVSFMEDGARGHTAKKTQKWHQDNGIAELPSWPGYSPDLNPIEHVWGHMKRALSKQNPMTIDGVKQIMQQIWDALDADYLTKLYESMPRRMAAVIAAKGGATKY